MVRGRRGSKQGDGKVAGSRKPPNCSLRGNDVKQEHDVTTDCGEEQLEGKQNVSSQC